MKILHSNFRHFNFILKKFLMRHLNSRWIILDIKYHERKISQKVSRTRFVLKKRLPSQEVVRRLWKDPVGIISTPRCSNNWNERLGPRIEVVGKRSKKRKAKWRKSEMCSFGYNRTSSTKMLAKHTSNVLERSMAYWEKTFFQGVYEKITKLTAATNDVIISYILDPRSRTS